MEKQTAVKWLIEELEEKGELRETFGIVHLIIDTSEYIDLKRKAKEMEKKQIIKAHNVGSMWGFEDVLEEGEKYYNETYKNK
jgi:hypothetical protein